MLVNEIKTLRRVRHPGIVNLHSVYESSDYIHLVLEYIKNKPLFDTVRERSNYSEATAAQIMKSLLKVIAHIHDNQIIYRDIKPENIILM